MDDRFVLGLTQQEARELSILRRRKYVGAGGIDVQMSPDGSTITFVLRILKNGGSSYTPPGLVPVTLTVDDGSTDGTATTTPAYTYKNPVNIITGAEIMKADGSHATGLSPAWARNIGSFNTALHGTLYVDSDGNPALWQVDETEKVC